MNSDGAKVAQAASSSGRRENCVVPSLAKARYSSSVIGFSPDADDGEARRQQAVDVQVVERGQQLAVRQIAGAAEDDDGDGLDFTHGGSGRRGRRTDGAARRADARRTDCPRATGTA